jgi:E3 SUMO-protein ligase NSE2
VQKVEKMVLEMLDSYEDCVALAEAVKSVPELYQPSDQVPPLPAF